ncbi:MAG: efflux RND transporter periplasmic adaptor subunit, partial [Synechococcus sp.]
MVAERLISIAPLSAPDKPLPAVVMEPLKRSRLRQLDRRQWIAAGLAVLIAASGLVIWRRSSAPGRDLSAYTTSVKIGQLDGVITDSGEFAAQRQVNLSPK